MCEEWILLQNDFTLQNLFGCEESLALARSLLDFEGTTGWFVRLPVLGLTLFGTVGSFPTDTALQLLLGLDLAESTRVHLLRVGDEGRGDGSDKSGGLEGLEGFSK